ncbi:hypothetical protein PV396_21625 [Streptomyces sp. ME02-8801-2C]|uniref:hypothetical protein n=1 Tax=Streptomyces sp. ME02-8801-2C TaxID=3028680 RepID=UPI0029A77593|nr:hypothetical protein [Streptomyces sp. ME02-8801-2C]MDX3454514.1 hypothetical protein [Streptomyces sp. ME02-8801-2C]
MVGYILDQVPALSAKAERAITALRRLKAAWHDSEGVRQQERAALEKSEDERHRRR